MVFPSLRQEELQEVAAIAVDEVALLVAEVQEAVEEAALNAEIAASTELNAARDAVFAAEVQEAALNVDVGADWDVDVDAESAFQNIDLTEQAFIVRGLIERDLELADLEREAGSSHFNGQAPATIEADDSIAMSSCSCIVEELTDAVDEVITDLKADLETVSEELASLAQETEKTVREIQKRISFLQGIYEKNMQQSNAMLLDADASHKAISSRLVSVEQSCEAAMQELVNCQIKLAEKEAQLAEKAETDKESTAPEHSCWGCWAGIKKICLRQS